MLCPDGFCFLDICHCIVIVLTTVELSGSGLRLGRSGVNRATLKVTYVYE